MAENEPGIIYDKSPSPSKGAEVTQGAKEDHPSGMTYQEDDLGLEEVSLQRPPVFSGHVGIHYDKTDPVADKVRLKDVPQFVSSAIKRAFAEGNYSILDHYMKIAENSAYIDKRMLPEIRSFAEEVKGLNNGNANAFLERLNGFLRALRVIENKEPKK